jgi:hypothetical protein
VKLPRDVPGAQAVKALARLGFSVARQASYGADAFQPVGWDTSKCS